MTYDIYKPTAPKMPALGKGTECIRLLLSQVSKDMHEPLVPMYFPDSTPRTAVNHLMSWITRCTQLLHALEASGYDKYAKNFTPRQISMIVEYLGEP